MPLFQLQDIVCSYARRNYIYPEPDPFMGNPPGGAMIFDWIRGHSKFL